MKRKLVDYDAFQRIKTESLSSAQKELEGAAPLLARTLELEHLDLNSYGAENALFEDEQGNFVHAKYQIQNGYVQFDNVEQLVINEETEINTSKEIISKMLDSLIESDETKAEQLFEEWLDLPRSKRIFTEAKVKRVVCRKGKKCKVVKWNNTPKHHEPANVTAKRVKGKKMSMRKTPSGVKKVNAMQRARLRKTIGEWSAIAENALGYVDLMENGPVIDHCQVLRKEGDVVAVRVPTTQLRNEAKLLKFNWKTMNTDVVVKRKGAQRISENEQFTAEVAELKRANALSDNRALEEAIEKVATQFPQVIYLTESELAGQIKTSLESVNDSNYDDETCRFLAEGILRTVHANFTDRVAKIVKLAGANINENASDKYAAFKSVTEKYFAELDESASLEMQAFVDVYEALRQIHELAKEESNEVVAEETASHLDELLSIIKKESDVSLEALAEAAEWLYDIVEQSAPESWKTDSPVVTHDGEHPDLSKKAKHSQSPAGMQGETPSAHHTSDGKECDGAAAKELEGEGWSNIGGEGIYPSLNNPYVPNSEIPKIHGEKDVDSDSGQLAHWGDGDTWPNLQNPYVKGSVTPDSVEE